MSGAGVSPAKRRTSRVRCGWSAYPAAAAANASDTPASAARTKRCSRTIRWYTLGERPTSASMIRRRWRPVTPSSVAAVSTGWVASRSTAAAAGALGSMARIQPSIPRAVRQAAGLRGPEDGIGRKGTVAQGGRWRAKGCRHRCGAESDTAQTGACWQDWKCHLVVEAHDLDQPRVIASARRRARREGLAGRVHARLAAPSSRRPRGPTQAVAPTLGRCPVRSRQHQPRASMLTVRDGPG